MRMSSPMPPMTPLSTTGDAAFKYGDRDAGVEDVPMPRLDTRAQMLPMPITLTLEVPEAESEDRCATGSPY